MSTVISSFIPFPNIYWWSLIAQVDEVIFDEMEHFEKMTYRNKYYIAGANGVIQLSIPLLGGRNQRGAMKDIKIANAEQWTSQQWRGITSSYRRTPYFEHYEPELKQLFETEYDKLIDFSKASINWLKSQLGLKYKESVATQYIASYEHVVVDMRKGLKHKAIEYKGDSLYYQPFDEREGFQPNLSMLDLLFCEGPNTMNIINENKELISNW